MAVELRYGATVIGEDELHDIFAAKVKVFGRRKLLDILSMDVIDLDGADTSMFHAFMWGRERAMDPLVVISDAEGSYCFWGTREQFLHAIEIAPIMWRDSDADTA